MAELKETKDRVHCVSYVSDNCADPGLCIDNEGNLYLDETFYHPFKYLSCSSIDFQGCQVPRTLIDGIIQGGEIKDTYSLYHTFKTKFWDELLETKMEDGSSDMDDTHSLSDVLYAAVDYKLDDVLRERMVLMRFGMQRSRKILQSRIRLLSEEAPERMNDCETDLTRIFRSIQASIDSGGKEVHINNRDSTLDVVLR